MKKFNLQGTIVQRRFTPDQSLKPKLLDESANLLEVKDFIIEFTNYIKNGYNPDEVPSVGYYVQMRNILEHSWIERLDRRKVMDKGLEDLCKVLHEEGEKKQAGAELGQAQPKLRFEIRLNDFQRW